MVQPEVMPVGVAIRFSHAVAQAVAEEHGIRVLHIKGPAVDESLLDVRRDDLGSLGAPVPRYSTDADVWVDPEAVETFIEVMQEHGWSLRVAFEDDSAFEHAATVGHLKLGYIDVHRYFPGIGAAPNAAFNLLWRDRGSAEIAGRPCAVPAVSAQRLVLLLHAARGAFGQNHPDIRRTWTEASETERAAVRGLAHELEAEVALAAATDELDQFHGHRERWLWQLLTDRSAGHSKVTIWAARVWAEPTPGRAVRTAVRLLLPKPQRLQIELGRPPTRREVTRAYLKRIHFGWRELVRSVRR